MCPLLRGFTVVNPLLKKEVRFSTCTIYGDETKRPEELTYYYCTYVHMYVATACNLCVYRRLSEYE